ncbi:MAG: [protein-PII] uridylyltransferase [Wenzhouxiangellaceae bacterium]
MKADSEPESPTAPGQDDHDLVHALSRSLEHLNADLERRFLAGEPVSRLVRRRAVGVARQLRRAWNASIATDSGLVLLAVGGSGRGELHPHSDIDLLVLAASDVHAHEAPLSEFFNRLWDAGLVLGHSVRNLEEALDDATTDVAFLTNLMEARWLAGELTLLRELRRGIADDRMWPAVDYFHAKYAEQEARHQRFNDTAYNLEPNIKEAPGGLRDLQVIIWVAMRRFGGNPLHALLEHGLITEREADEFIEAREFLWRLRWGLHRLAGRAEERLLFEYQRNLAEFFGYRDAGEHNRAVEQFMQNYYRTVMQLERLNERVLQQYQEEFITSQREQIEHLDESFQIHNGYLEVRHEECFRRQPRHLLSLFLWLQRRPEIKGVRASTIRLVREYLYLIDDGFRADSVIWQRFYEILCEPRRLYNTLQRMNRYGVLASLLPPFATIVGRMQFDLFHVYTVDQHTLFVIRNLRRIASGRYEQQFARATPVFSRIDQPQLLYLAALFHDIAKGRGGDHSELGANDAEYWCSMMPIKAIDRRLVAWLVRYHLLLSRTAQREDISDPEVIYRFARTVGDQRHLDYLYLLTVADIAATAPSLWTSWKDSLLWDLYQSAQRAFQEGLDSPPDRELLIEETQADALRLLRAGDADLEQVEAHWRDLPESAFVRAKPDQLAWMTATAMESHQPCVAIRNLEKERISELFVHVDDYDGLFACVVDTLDAMRCNVLAARVLTSDRGQSWDLFQLLDANGNPLVAADQQRMLRDLQHILSQRQPPSFRAHRVPRRLREFLAPTKVHFNRTEMTVMWLECTDRPGLLSILADVLLAQKVRIHDARIATFGDRVEDVFILSDHHDQALGEQAQLALTQELIQRLDWHLEEQT